jgi:phthiocerol/phenolphthiocerol synthesis type-I polyketide synthase E
VADSETQESYSDSEIAVVGMAGRFPRARGVEEFWRNLRDGVEAITFLTGEELAALGLPPTLTGDPNYVNAASVLEGVEEFDARFFDYLPREAEVMDPQQRLFLESAWEALERAGYDSERYRGSVGVFAGVSMSTYLLNLYSNPDAVRLMTRFQLMIGNDKDHLSTRVSYKMNLKGPSISVQTTCSTSLVAVHLACQSLLNGECDMALAGGVSVKIPQKTGYLYREGGISSPDGHCRAFDAKAQGTIGGNGVGVVVLKRLADAAADGDTIHAVVKGSAINNDGSLKVGYTAPSVEGQSEVISEALSMADVDPETITYVEAHGTGTALGDPIEIAALTKAYRARTKKKGFCAVGSVKTNVGHLDAAAGVAGLIKTVLALSHRQIPPSLHFTRPNPKIDFENSPFFVNASLREWESDAGPRRAGVSSFGIGGTNAHVVLEEAPEAGESSDSRPSQLILLSAKTEDALERATDNLAAHLRQNPEVKLPDAAYTLQVGRRAFAHRRALVCRDAEEAALALQSREASRVLTNACELRSRPVAFMFPGQGAQYVRMGLGLYRVEESFRKDVDACSEILRAHLGLELRSVLFPPAGREDEAARELAETRLTQPALFVVEYALARLWMSWGVRPSAMIGHSIGEYVAACLSGVFPLEDALRLVAARGRLMQGLPSGAMLAVPLGEEEVAPLLGGRVSLAAVNGAKLCVLSGPPDAVSELEEELGGRGVASRRLHTSHAFHSAMMEPMLAEFEALVGRTRLGAPNIPFVSNLSGDWVTAAEATDAGYWARHLRQTVRFAEGLSLLLKEQGQVLLEVGPGQTLSTHAKRHPLKGAGHAVLNSLPPPQAKQPAADAYLLGALGRLWLEGVNVDWGGFYAPERRRRIVLPTYPFERQRYWIGHSEEAPRPADARELSGTPVSKDEPPARAQEPARLEESGASPRAPEQTPTPTPPPAPSVPVPAPALPGPQAFADGRGHATGRRAAQERIVAQQLEIMSRQLEALRQARRGGGA